jgi:hypothetical protein
MFRNVRHFLLLTYVILAEDFGVRSSSAKFVQQLQTRQQQGCFSLASDSLKRAEAGENLLKVLYLVTK